jgi:hypothetical protein
MDDNYYKEVLLPITVAIGDYCWGCERTPLGSFHRICTHFDNEGGHPVCNLDIGQLHYDRRGYVLKPLQCLILQNVNSTEEEPCVL